MLPPSIRIVEAVARRENCPPRDLDPLYDVVDADALDYLFTTSSRTVGQVMFWYAGYSITLYANGELDVEEFSSEGESGRAAV